MSKYPFYKKHKTQERFWDYKTKSWLKVLPDKNCVIINYQGYNIHPSHWNENWFKAPNWSDN